MLPIYGSLTISATTPTKQFPVFNVEFARPTSHTESKYRGLCYEQACGHTVVENAVALPQRNKYMLTTVVSDRTPLSMAVSKSLTRCLVDLDSRFEGARQLYKMQMLMKEIDPRQPYVATINNTSEHATITLLAQGSPLYVLGVYDGVNKSVRLVWTTDPDFVQIVRAEDPTRYVFYRYPDLFDRPLFIHTQNVCANWFSWSKNFEGPDSVLKIFNALENFLYKNPNTATLGK
jgi:hypothetical protein